MNTSLQFTMAISQERSKKKVTGSRYIKLRKKKQFELGRDPTFSKLGERKTKLIRVMSGKKKEITMYDNKVNIVDPKTKKTKISKILNVIENSANRHFVRRNILTKGTIVDTELGKAKITSRPGQEGSLNAVLIEKK
jgi:small subunit ribosomal protein S8e